MFVDLGDILPCPPETVGPPGPQGDDGDQGIVPLKYY